MTDDPRPDREVRAWIRAEAPEHAPDHLGTAIRSELALARQERGPVVFMQRGWRRTPVWTGIAAILVLALGVLAVGLLGTSSPVANPVPTTTPSAIMASPAVSTSPAPTPSGIILPSGPTTTDVFRPTLRFSAPAGWIQLYDQPMVFHISPSTAGFLRQTDGQVYFDGITVWDGPVAGPPDGGPARLEGVGTSAKELATWLSTRPQLLASAPTKVTLGGLSGYRLDFTLSPDAGELCGVPCVNLLNSLDRGASYQFGIEGPWRVRAFLLDRLDGSTVMITVEDVDGNGFDREVRAAQPVLDSMSFEN